MIDLIKNLSLVTNETPERLKEILNSLENVIIHELLKDADSISNNGLTIETDMPLISTIIISKDKTVLINPSNEFISKLKQCINNNISPVVADAIKKLSNDIVTRYYNGDLLK